MVLRLRNEFASGADIDAAVVSVMVLSLRTVYIAAVQTPVDQPADVDLIMDSLNDLPEAEYDDWKNNKSIGSYNEDESNTFTSGASLSSNQNKDSQGEDNDN